MQNIVGVNLLLLFLILVSCVILVSSSYTDLNNTRLLHSVANLGNSKLLYTAPSYLDMQSGSRMSSIKRFFQDLESEGTSAASETFAHEDVNTETILDQHIYQDEHGDALDQFHIGMRDHQQNSNHKITKRTMFFDHMGDEGTSAKDVLENSFSFGQAIYQKAKQGVIIQYKDHGDNTFQCVHCNAYYWRDEKNTRGIYTGCQQGQVRLPPSNPTPQFLEQLLDLNNGRESILFKENIRVYNSMFSFTSMGTKIDHHINDGSGPYVFKICGQVHHLMGSVLPLDGELPKYVQLYVYDTHNEISNRMNAIDPFHNNQKTKQDIVKKLIQMFDEINELTKTFRTVKDKFENDSLPSFNMTILGRRPIDSKQYEEPTNEEIAGLIVGDIGEFNSNKDIIIHSNEGHLQRISKIHPKYMSLQYPILFPYGEDGYKLDLLLEPIAGNQKKKREKMSMRSFVAYQIHDRNNNTSTLLKGGRLFQQYLVDAYVTVEECRLDYIRRNQNLFRSEKSKEIYAAVLLELLIAVI